MCFEIERFNRREVISLAPRLQPGDRELELGNETVSNGFGCVGSMRNRWKRFIGSLDENFDHRAEAAVLMRSLRAAMILFDGTRDI
jgi:hypothetical protein